MNPDKSTLEALGRVYRSEPTFIAFLEELLNEYRRHVSRITDIEQVRWMQGRMQQLEDILSDLKKASLL